MSKRRLPRKLKKRFKKKGFYKFWLESGINHIKSLEGLINIYRLFDIHNSLMDVVDDEPEFGMMLNDILKGDTVYEAFTRYYGPESFSEPGEGEPDYEEYEEYKKYKQHNRKLNEI